MQEGSTQSILQQADAQGRAIYVAPFGPVASFMAPVRHSPGRQTMLALSSIGPALQLQISLRDGNGQVVQNGTASLNLPANGEVARSLNDLFPQAAPGSAGSLTVTGAPDASVAVMVLEQEGDRLSSLPVSPLR